MGKGKGEDNGAADGATDSAKSQGGLEVDGASMTDARTGEAAPASSKRELDPKFLQGGRQKGTKRISNFTIAMKLREFSGNITRVAEAIGRRREGLSRRILKNRYLRAICEEAKNGLLDEAVYQLGVAVKKGEPWAVQRVLDSAHARERGWGTRTENLHLHATPEQMAKYQKHLASLSDEELSRLITIPASAVGGAAKAIEGPAGEGSEDA